jgi:tRNA(Leu) C34 or U34 (ribose-2'-O)-methylase TrmL
VADRFVVKDSGQRLPYESGMVRDTQDGKARFDLIRPKGVPYDAQFMTRVAMHMTNGAKKYGFRNWEKADSTEELERFEGSAERHLQQYLSGDREEDHAAAVVFNLIAAETTRWKLEQAGAAAEP